MSAKKKKKKGRPRPAIEVTATSVESKIRPETRVLILATLVTTAIVGALVVHFITFAGNAVFFTDECFHAFRAERLAHLDYPAIIPEIYSGWLNCTQPFFHILGAIDYLFFGRAGLPYLNIFIFIVLCAGGFYFAARYISPLVAAAALLAFITSNLVPHFALAFYQEMLTTLVFSATLVFLYLTYVREEWKFAVLAGICLGILLLTKQTARLMPLCIMVVWVYLILKKDWHAVKRFLLLGITAILTWVPHLIYLAVWTGSPFYPYFSSRSSSRIHERFASLQTRKWATTPGGLLKDIWRDYEIVCCVLVIAAIIYFAYRVFLKDRKKGYGLLFFIVSAHTLVFLFYGSGASSRHFLQLLPFFCLFGVIGFFYLFDRLNLRLLKYAAFIVLAVWGIDTVSDVFGTEGRNRPGYRDRLNYRKGLNCNPVFLDAYRYIKEKTPNDAIVMSVWTYSTYYYTERPTTWPHGGSSESPINIYFEKDKDRFFEICKNHKIGYILVDYRMVKKPDSTSYPPYFIKCIHELVQNGKASCLYKTPRDFAPVVDLLNRYHAGEPLTTPQQRSLSGYFNGLARRYRGRTPPLIAVYKIHIST